MSNFVKQWGTPGNPEVYMRISGPKSFIVHSKAVPYGIVCEDITHANYVFTGQINALKGLHE